MPRTGKHSEENLYLICGHLLAPSTACCLIALEKNPGIRPIEIGEVIRRIIGKAVLKVIRPDIMQVIDNSQLCAGQEAGIESAVHVIDQLFNEESTKAALLIDPSNAFNCLNRQTALRNFMQICTALAPIAINTYHEDAHLFIDLVRYDVTKFTQNLRLAKRVLECTCGL